MKISFFNDRNAQTIGLNELIAKNSIVLKSISDLDFLIEKIGESKYVLLGEASHGTHEYYTWRTGICKRLIEENGFNFIAVEGDWPDCYKINRYLKRYTDTGNDIANVLKNFDRWLPGCGVTGKLQLLQSG